MKQRAISLAFVLFFVTLPSVELLGQNPFAENVRKTKPLTPQQQLETFTLPSGFKISLVAAEPDIFKPMKWHQDGLGFGSQNENGKVCYVVLAMDQEMSKALGPEFFANVFQRLHVK